MVDAITDFGINGRREINTSVEEITEENLINVLNEVLPLFEQNSSEIDYLYKYERGLQPILERHKEVRPEICNKVIENHAIEIKQFVSGYFLGEPVTYVRRGENEKATEYVNILNDYMYFEDKPSKDKELADWLATCGVGYRMVLPDTSANVDPDKAPFEIETLDPRFTFVVYNSGFGHRRIMGVRQIFKNVGLGAIKTIYSGYTKDHYFEVVDGSVKWEPHSLNDIPIFEYRLNTLRIGSFEPAIPLMDALNTLASNRVDGVEEFIQSFLKFKNCDWDEDEGDGDKATAVKQLRKLGAISINNPEGLDCDVEIISQELNQTQTQTLVDYIYQQILVICGLPTTTKGGSSTSDTGVAVVLRDGWQQAETRARDTELLFKRSEKEFLKFVLRILKDSNEQTVDWENLSLSEIECKFTRRQHDNLVTKTQGLLQMLQAGLSPEVAIATCGLFNDPLDVALQSKDYLQKWNYIPLDDSTDEVDSEGDVNVEE